MNRCLAAPLLSGVDIRPLLDDEASDLLGVAILDGLVQRVLVVAGGPLFKQRVCQSVQFRVLRVGRRELDEADNGNTVGT